jgi:hypothetical protein
MMLTPALFNVTATSGDVLLQERAADSGSGEIGDQCSALRYQRFLPYDKGAFFSAWGSLCLVGGVMASSPEKIVATICVSMCLFAAISAGGGIHGGTGPLRELRPPPPNLGRGPGPHSQYTCAKTTTGRGHDTPQRERSLSELGCPFFASQKSCETKRKRCENKL